MTRAGTSGNVTWLDRFIVMCLFVVLLLTSASAHAQQACAKPASKRPFRVFDATLYAGKPSLAAVGIEPLHQVGPDIGGFQRNKAGPVEPEAVSRFVNSLPKDGAGIVMDFELLESSAQDAQAKETIARLQKIASKFRAAAPNRRIGFYADFPASDYWRAIKPPMSPEAKSWRAQNDRARSIEEFVDVLYPSIYTYYNDRTQWVIYATAQICEARRLSDKPVYAFLWPEYHEGANVQRGRMIDPEFWALQLRTVRHLADGVVIWGGYDIAAKRPRRWSPNDEWWKVTREFMRRDR